ncbi:hypothetical protein NC651_031460 [Populus alba x Populus x berolinensis]|nr:hypothetical protein NC651_031460 [Populus alba x Populus x berolinensis]
MKRVLDTSLCQTVPCLLNSSSLCSPLHSESQSLICLSSHGVYICYCTNNKTLPVGKQNQRSLSLSAQTRRTEEEFFENLMRFPRNGNPLRLFHKLIEFLSVSRTFPRNLPVEFCCPNQLLNFERYLMGRFCLLVLRFGESGSRERRIPILLGVNTIRISLVVEMLSNAFANAGDLVGRRE